MKKKQPKHDVITWDWKDQPDWDEVASAVNMVKASGKQVFIAEVDTESDSYAIIISDAPLSKELTAELWDKYCEGDEEIDE